MEKETHRARLSVRDQERRAPLVLVSEVAVGTAAPVVQAQEKEKVAQVVEVKAVLEVEAAAQASEQVEDRGAVPGVVRDSARELEVGQARARARALDLFLGLALSAVVALLGLPPLPAHTPPDLRIAPPTVSISFQPRRVAAD